MKPQKCRTWFGLAVYILWEMLGKMLIVCDCEAPKLFFCGATVRDDAHVRVKNRPERKNFDSTFCSSTLDTVNLTKVSFSAHFKNCTHILVWNSRINSWNHCDWLKQNYNEMNFVTIIVISQPQCGNSEIFLTWCFFKKNSWKQLFHWYQTVENCRTSISPTFFAKISWKQC